MTKCGRLGILATLVAMICVGAGCGGDEERPSQSPPGPKASSSVPADRTAPGDRTSRMTPTNGAPVSMVDTLKQKRDLPASYPADGFIYPDTRPSEVRVEPDGRIFVIFGTSDDHARVSARVEEVLGANNWTIERQQTMPNGELFMCSKDGRVQNVVISEFADGNGETTRMVAVTVEP